MEIKGFITNLGKYNEGKLIGKWITFPIDEDELNDVLKEIGCAYEDEDGNMQNPEYEEYFFTDWECDVDLDLGEYINIENVNELAESINDIDDDLAEAIIELDGIDGLANADHYMFLPEVNSDYDLGYYWIEESGCYDLDKLGNLRNYIDYEKFGRDCRLDTCGQFTSHGYIEYVG